MRRKDGTRVTNEVPMYYLVPHFMRERSDAMNMVTLDIPVEPLRQYMNAKRKEGKKISHMALIMTAYAHMAAEYPSVNRFIVNRKIYQHNDFTVSLVVLRPGRGNDDTMRKLYLSAKDTVFDVQKKIDAYIEENSGEQRDNSLDRIMEKICKLNGLIRIATNLIYFLDKHGMLPKSIIEASPFHASLLISNLASIRTNHIYHHVYNFGTTSVGITMGNMREIPHRAADGSVRLERCLPLGVVMDERIASGHYLALAFNRFKEILTTPELLENPGSEVVIR